MEENLLLKYLKRTPRTPQDKPEENAVKVKQEKKDVAQAKPSAPPPPPTPQRKEKTQNNAPLLKEKVVPSIQPPQPLEDETLIDYKSICGQFGWIVIDNDSLPFILRAEEQFVAVRIVESEIISKYTKILPWHVFTSTNIKSYYVTNNEAKLLNDINDNHCERRFGSTPFTIRDVVVSVGDASKFQRYLEVCKCKLFPEKTRKSEIFREKCGSLFLNQRFIVPYLRKGGVKLVPKAFLPDDLILSPEYLEQEKSSILDWDMAYLKFVCHVANLDPQKIQSGHELCPLEGLLSQATGEKVSVEEHAFSQPPLDNESNSASSRSDWLKQQALRSAESAGKQVVQQLFRGTGNKLTYDYSKRVPVISYCDQQPTQSHLEGGGYREPVRRPNTVETAPRPTKNESYRDRVAFQPAYSEQNSAASRSQHANKKSGLAKFGQTKYNGTDLFPPPPPLVRTGRQPNDMQSLNGMQRDHGSFPPPLNPISCNPATAAAIGLMDVASRQSLANLFATGGPESVALLNRLSSESLRGLCQNQVSASPVRNSNQVGDYEKTSRHFSNNRLASLNSSLPPHPYPTPPQSSPLQGPATPMALTSTICPSNSSHYSEGSALAHHQSGPLVASLCSPPPSPEHSVRRLSSSTVSNSDHEAANHLLQQNQLSGTAHLLHHVEVDRRLVPVTNLEPFKYHTQLVTSLSLVQKLFFPNVAMQSLLYALKNVLGIRLHSGSGLHYMVLKNQFTTASFSQDALLSVENLQCYFPHLTYMFQQNEEGGVSLGAEGAVGSRDGSAASKKARLGLI